jgi:hypothetical protein
LMTNATDEATTSSWARYPRWAGEEYHEHERRTSKRFRAHLRKLMEQRGVESIEELYERFLAVGYRIPVPGRHRNKPVPLEEFRLHSARAYPSSEEPKVYAEFICGLGEALELSEEEFSELAFVYLWGEWPRRR